MSTTGSALVGWDSHATGPVAAGLCNWKLISSWQLTSLDLKDAIYLIVKSDSANNTILLRDLLITVIATSACVFLDYPDIIPFIVTAFFLKFVVWLLRQDLCPSILPFPKSRLGHAVKSAP